MDVQFNLHTTAASTLNQILSSLQYAKDIKEELEVSHEVQTQTSYEVFILQPLGSIA